MIRTTRRASVVCLAVLYLSGPAGLRADDDILTTAAGNGSFKTLVSLVVAAGLDEALQGDGHFTVFAPTDAAFEQLPAETLQTLLKPENRAQLADILKYHVLPDELSAPRQAPSHPVRSATTLLGETLKFRRDGDDVFVNEARITTRNIRCSNGLIQVIDGVLLPPQPSSTIVQVAEQAGSFKRLLAAVEAAGLTETLMGEGPFTVLAPTDDAFQALPPDALERLLEPKNRDQLAAILKYHVIRGRVSAQAAVAAGRVETIQGESVSATISDGVLKMNDARVTANDITADNGLIHVIDSVLLPGHEKSDSETASGMTRREKKVVTIRGSWDDHIARDGIVADTIEISVSGGGSVQLTHVQARLIKTTIGGGSSVTLTGSAETLEARVSGGATLRAADLPTGSARVQVAGGGQASLNATRLLEVTASAGAEITFVPTDAEIRKQINQYASFTPISQWQDGGSQ